MLDMLRLARNAVVPEGREENVPALSLSNPIVHPERERSV